MPALTIRDGCRVAIRYTLRDSDGALLEQSGDAPSVYIHGSAQLVPGLYQALLGRAAGERFELEVPPAEGYGERTPSVGPQPIPLGTFPEGTSLVAGMEFPAETPEGQPLTLYITNVTEHMVLVDRNHPFAGKTLHYAVEVVAVEPPAAASS